MRSLKTHMLYYYLHAKNEVLCSNKLENGKCLLLMLFEIATFSNNFYIFSYFVVIGLLFLNMQCYSSRCLNDGRVASQSIESQLSVFYNNPITKL